MPLWSCTVCLKSFARKGDLTRHELIHTGIKPHICEVCGKGFRQNSGLKTHRNVHTGERPYTCDIGTCKKTFGDPSSRTRHRKETHCRGNAYKCVIADCGTRIKRRSTFVTHLRKHGLDPESIDLNVIAAESRLGEVSASAHFASTNLENKSGHEMKAQSVPPSFLSDSPGYCTLGDASQASRFTGNHGWLGHGPSDFRRDSWSRIYDTLLLGSMLDQTGSSGHLHEVTTHSSDNLGDPFYFDGILPTVDCPLLIDSHLNFPTSEQSSEAGSDGLQSSWSSPSSTYSSLVDDGSQDSLLYGFM